MSSSKKKANGAKEKPTKYDITIKYTDKDMPFILEEMTHRSNKDINNNTGARLSKLINKEYENIATSEDILVSVNKTVVLKLSLWKIFQTIKIYKSMDKPSLNRLISVISL